MYQSIPSFSIPPGNPGVKLQNLANPCIFGKVSNSFLIFDPLLILGLNCKFYNVPLSSHYRSCSQISFSKLMPIQIYGRRTFSGVDLTPLVKKGLSQSVAYHLEAKSIQVEFFNHQARYKVSTYVIITC